MTDQHIDPLLDRAVKELRTLPPVDKDAVARVVAAAAAARVSPADDDEPLMPRRRRVWWVPTIGLAAAAAFAGFMLRGAITRQPTAEPTAARAVKAAPIATTPVVAGDLETLPIPTAFTLEHATASRVSLVGDFNKWNPESIRLVRQPGTNVWSIVVPITPGRHVYAFMIDDSVLTLDPRAPKAKDPALGVDASVVLVGKP